MRGFLMFITRLKLHNFRNFHHIDVELQRRVFILGANATGKSNLLDALRFLRDVAKDDGGGLRAAVRRRQSFRHVRSLMARGKNNYLAISVEVATAPGEAAEWVYELAIRQETAGARRVLVKSERVFRCGELILDRPNEDDRRDDQRLTQTALEQVNSNVDFRPLAEFFGSVRYLNLVPQMLRFGQEMRAEQLPDDPFGQGFLELVMRTNRRTREARLRRIQESLHTIIPQFTELRTVTDEASGRPHLEAKFEHWRSRGAWQREHELSDGTLRLIALMWTAQEPGGPLLLEEPELSLHDTVIRSLAGAFAKVSRGAGRQVFVTTHSPTLLNDDAISLGEVVLLKWGENGTSASLADSDPTIRALIDGGQPRGDVLVPWVGVKSPQFTFVR